MNNHNKGKTMDISRDLLEEIIINFSNETMISIIKDYYPDNCLVEALIDTNDKKIFEKLVRQIFYKRINGYLRDTIPSIIWPIFTCNPEDISDKMQKILTQIRQKNHKEEK